MWQTNSNSENPWIIPCHLKFLVAKKATQIGLLVIQAQKPLGRRAISWFHRLLGLPIKRASWIQRHMTTNSKYFMTWSFRAAGADLPVFGCFFGIQKRQKTSIEFFASRHIESLVHIEEVHPRVKEHNVYKEELRWNLEFWNRWAISPQQKRKKLKQLGYKLPACHPLLQPSAAFVLVHVMSVLDGSRNLSPFSPSYFFHELQATTVENKKFAHLDVDVESNKDLWALAKRRSKEVPETSSKKRLSKGQGPVLPQVSQQRLKNQSTCRTWPI